MISVFCLVTVGPLTGCRSCERVESELRKRDFEVAELRGELDRLQGENRALYRELEARQAGEGNSAKISPEAAAYRFGVQTVTLGRQTAGLDDDDCPGDEAIQVVVEPRDFDGHAIKAPGHAHIEAYEVSMEGLKTLISTWDVPPEHLRRTWKSGLLSTGYYLKLSWQNWPTTPKVRIVLRFTLPDQRTFEADKDVTIRPSRTEHRPVIVSPPPPVWPMEPLAPPAPEPVPLPPPRKLDGESGPNVRHDGRSNPVEPSDWRTAKPVASLHSAVQLLAPVPRTRRDN
jgi:hypothetical protein